MNEIVNGAAKAVDEDIDTTAPNPPLEWKMPEPVFRQTSGRSPESFEKHVGTSASIAEEVTGETNIGSGPPADQKNTCLEPTPKNPTLKLILVLLGLAAMIAFIAVFLTLIYFLFLR